MGGMTERDLFPIVACADLPGAIRFYEATFGAVLDYRFPDEGEAVYVTLRIGDSKVALAAVGDGPNAYGERSLPATGHPVDLCVYVDDLDATLAAAADAGGELRVPPADMPWGERVAWVRDTEGIMLLVIQG